MLALQPTMGFSPFCDFLPFHPFLTQILHPLIPIIWISSSASSIHLFLGLSLILLHIGFHSNILLGILPLSIRILCPSPAILLLYINLTMFVFPMSSFSSWFFLILQIPFSYCTGPKIFLNIFRSNFPMYIVVYYLSVYSFTDPCHRVETQLQLIKYHVKLTYGII